MRRRQIAAVAAGVIALAVGLVVVSRGGSAESTAPRTRSSTLQAAAPGVERPLTYAEGQTVHLGDRSIDTHLDLLSLDVTDDGAAFTTFDGGVWFTDGSTVTQIGLTSPARVTRTGVDWGPAGRPDDRIVAEETGSRLAWLEYPQVGHRLGRPEIVVYDTGQRRRVARLPIEPSLDCAVCAQIVSVGDDTVYWTDIRGSDLLPGDRGGSTTRLFRDQVSTGRQRQVPVAAYQAQLRRTPRTIVVGSSAAAGSAEDGIGENFAFVGGVLVVHAMGVGDAAFDAQTGRRLRLLAPPELGGLGPARWFYLFEWLDNDRFALLDATAWNSGVHRGEDILVCSLAGSRCSVAVRRPSSAYSPIVPGLETAGTELAERRAVSGR